MADKITIGCRLPSGIALEVGLQATVKGGPFNRPLSLVKRTDQYKRIILRGTHRHTAKMRAAKIQVPSMMDPEPFFTDVPLDFWQRWKKEHPGSPLLTNGDLFEVANEGDKKAITIDVQARPQPMQPLDPSKKIVVDGNTVEKADFGDDDDK